MSEPGALTGTPTIVAGLLLDRSVSDDGQLAKLLEICAWFFSLGARHVSVSGAGNFSPSQMNIVAAGYKLASSQSLPGEGHSYVLHFVGAHESHLRFIPAEGGRQIIVAAARSLAAVGQSSVIDDEVQRIAGPAPDFLVLFGRAVHLSGSFVWQAAYAELIPVDETWTNFTASAADGVCKQFRRRNRRFGALTESAEPSIP